MNKVVKAHLALLIVNAIYGANYNIVKAVVHTDIEPYALVVLRAFFSAILFWASGIFSPKEKIERKDFYKLLMLGVFGIALNQLTFIKGLSMTSSINASIIMIFNPVIVMLLEVIFFKEKTPFIRILGIALGIGGAMVLLFGRRDVATAHVTLLGDILILINCTSWAIYLVMVKPLMMKYKTVTVVKWVFAFGAIYVFPFGFGELQGFKAGSIGTNAWMCIIFIIVASTYIAYYLNTYALAELSPSIASTYIYLQPLIAAAIAVWYKQDTIDAVKIMSGVLIMGGIYLVGRSRKKQKEMEAIAEREANS